MLLSGMTLLLNGQPEFCLMGVLSLFFFLASVLALLGDAEPVADLVVVNAKVITVCKSTPRAEGFAVRGGKFPVVGAKGDVQALIGRDTDFPRTNLRHRIEHASVALPPLLERAKRLGVVLALHSYIYEHGDKMEPYGAFRWSLMHPNRSALDMGIPVAGTSDYPVSAADPLLRIQDLATRRSAQGKVRPAADHHAREGDRRLDTRQRLGEAREGWPVHLLLAQLFVEDSDALFERAVNAGAKVTMPMTEMFFGFRVGHVVDPFRGTWVVSSRKEIVSLEEMQRRINETAF